MQYNQYFVVKDTPTRSRKVTFNDDAIQEFIDSNSCYWVLISTSAKTWNNKINVYIYEKEVGQVGIDVTKPMAGTHATPHLRWT